MWEKKIFESAQKDFNEMIGDTKPKLQSNGKNEHTQKKKPRQHDTMRQPTPPKDSNQHTVPLEGNEGVITRLLSARGLCYKEKN